MEFQISTDVTEAGPYTRPGEKLIQGVHAALLTPRLEDGSIDEKTFCANAAFLLDSGVKGVVLNGATGEYHRTGEGEFRRMVELVSGLAGQGRFLAGIGSSNPQTTVENGLIALEAGALALLLPAPHFFRYAQEDIATYARYIAERVPGPILLYNLPQFANGYEPSTVEELTSTVPNIIGVKDSSGTLDVLRALTVTAEPEICRIVGSDNVLVEARKEGVFDGLISGIACVLPELMLQLGSEDAMQDAARYEATIPLLQEILDQLQRFPVPWGLMWIAERRGLAPARFPLPLSEFRRSQGASFGAWIEQWWRRARNVVPLGDLPK